MEITPRELRDIEIHSEIRGYSRDEVNDLLERAAAAIDASNQRVTQMQDRLTSAQSEAVRTRETEDILHRTLLLAQRAADEAVAEATAKSRQMLDEAEMSSRRLVAESEADARRKGESERRRLEQEIVELAGRRDALLADVEALTRFEAEYRERMTRALESDLSAFRDRTTTAPGATPETSDVEIPSARTDVGEAHADDASSPRSSAAAEAIVADDTDDADQPESDTANREPGSGIGSFTAESASNDTSGQRSGSERSGSHESHGAETSEVDVRTLFEQSHQPQSSTPSREQSSVRDQPAGEASPPAPPGSARAAGLQPLDLASSDSGVDADVLDDDAFFATLRDAVHDEAPLGPREEGDDVTGENRFFDQDAERGTFRDVFRRRR
jgi:cell division initiation protein